MSTLTSLSTGESGVDAGPEGGPVTLHSYMLQPRFIPAESVSEGTGAA